MVRQVRVRQARVRQASLVSLWEFEVEWLAQETVVGVARARALFRAASFAVPQLQ